MESTSSYDITVTVTTSTYQQQHHNDHTCNNYSIINVLTITATAETSPLWWSQLQQQQY
jgi:hypothetical protein